MNLFVNQLFVRSSVSCLRTHAFSVVSRSMLKMHRTSFVQKCCRTSTTVDLTKLSDSASTDDFDFDEESSFSKVDVDAITKGDPDKLKTLRSLQLEVGVMKLKELEMPSTLSAENWKDMMEMTTMSQRRKFLRHLWLKEVRGNIREKNKLKKRELYKEFKASEISERKVLTTSSPIKYGLNDVFLFQIIRDCTIHRFYDYKLLQAEWFGPHIILDCGYDLFMSRRNLGTCVKEMMFAWSTNRENINPFDIMFCNLNRNGPLWSKFKQVCPTLDQPDCPVHYTDEHYLKYFPKEKCVYLTPHCNEVLEKYNPDDIYIIGAYVDLGSCEELSLAKAKKEGLRKAKLPLDQYLKWKQGTKSLSMHTVLAIINELKDGQSWPEALKHVPCKRVEINSDFDNADNSNKIIRLTAHSIRENYRKNLVYDLLLQKKFNRPPEES